MKNKLLPIIILVTGFVACDTIDGPYTEKANQLTSDVVLIEFTGMKCPNCPLGHAAIEELVETYGGKIHPVAIHTGNFAKPDNEFPADYRSDTGNSIYDEMEEPSSFPSGTVNSFSADDVDSPTSWASKVAEQGNLSPKILMTITFSITDSIINLSLTAQSTTSLSGNLRLCAYLTEDKVIGKQINGSVIIEEYEHNHMLRASFGDVWGQKINLGSKIEKQFTMNLKKEWNKDNLRVVPFVFDYDSRQILPADIIFTE